MHRPFPMVSSPVLSGKLWSYSLLLKASIVEAASSLNTTSTTNNCAGSDAHERQH